MNGAGLWKMPVAGGAAVYIARTYAFVPTKEGLYYFDQNVPLPSFPVSFLDFKTQERRVIGALPGPEGAGGSIAISPDSHWLLYNKFDHQGSELMLVDNFR